MTVAIIGTGIAGLGCAHFLHPKVELTLYEQNDYAGGHTNTVNAEENGRAVPIDTGFMVFNKVTYPNLTRLFGELGVRCKPACMSFSVQHRQSGLEYNGLGFNKLFGQRRNLVNVRFLRMLTQIKRFFADANHVLHKPGFEHFTVRQFVTERGYGRDFLDLYLVPMSSAVWSTPPDAMLEFPALTLLRFFHNHGFLGVHTHHPWLTVAGGARTYVERLTAPFHDRIRLSNGAQRVAREDGKARVYATDGSCTTYDKVVFASHADQTLAMLADPTRMESELLNEFRYQHNTATLHTDSSFMPNTRRCWASWNYRIDKGAHSLPSTHYWMNSLQGVSENANYFVSLNVHDQIAPEKVIKRIEYEHPVFSLGAIKAQVKLPELNRISRDQTTYFCGSYFKYGFHEDAFTSGLECARDLTQEAVWT